MHVKKFMAIGGPNMGVLYTPECKENIGLKLDVFCTVLDFLETNFVSLSW